MGRLGLIKGCKCCAVVLVLGCYISSLAIIIFNVFSFIMGLSLGL